MWVLKLGGSLYAGNGLHDWLGLLASSAAPLLLVPGGGPFADQVRLAQRQRGFDDATAHRMALLAMEQYGLMLCGLCDRLRPARSVEEMVSASRQGRVPVWMPSDMALSDPHIEQGWQVTSDSLSLWLAQQITAQGLLLVKSAPRRALSGSARQLLQRGVLDDAFADMQSPAGPSVWLVNQADASAMSGWRGEPMLPDCCLSLAAGGATSRQRSCSASNSSPATRAQSAAS